MGASTCCELPSVFYLFFIYPNQSYDGNPLKEDEQLFPNESLPFPKFLSPLSFEQAVEFLWRDQMKFKLCLISWYL